MYDGTNWVIVDGGMATTTYYGSTKLTSDLTGTSEVLALTQKAGNTLNTNKLERPTKYSFTNNQERNITIGTNNIYLVYATSNWVRMCLLLFSNGTSIGTIQPLVETIGFTATINSGNNLLLYMKNNSGHDCTVNVLQLN